MHYKALKIVSQSASAITYVAMGALVDRKTAMEGTGHSKSTRKEVLKRKENSKLTPKTVEETGNLAKTEKLLFVCLYNMFSAYVVINVKALNKFCVFATNKIQKRDSSRTFISS